MISSDEAREYIDTLLHHFRDKLSSWELQFVQDMEERLDDDKPLSEKQLKKIDEIMTVQARSHGR